MNPLEQIQIPTGGIHNSTVNIINNVANLKDAPVGEFHMGNASESAGTTPETPNNEEADIHEANQVNPDNIQVEDGRQEIADSDMLTDTPGTSQHGRKRTRREAKMSETKTEIGTPKKKKPAFKNFKVFSLELTAELQIAEGNYNDAVFKVTELFRMQKNPLKYYFMEAELDMVLDRDHGNQENKKRSNAIRKMFTSVPPGITEIVDLIQFLIEKERYVRALILLIWANEYGKFDAPPPTDRDFKNEYAPAKEEKPNTPSDNEHYNINQLIYQAYQVAKKLTNINRNIAERYGLSIMFDMFDKVQKIQKVEQKWKVRREAVCCHMIGSIQSSLRLFDEAIASSKKSIIMLEDEFGKKAEEYQTVGHALQNIGYAKQKLGEKDEAIKKYKEAIKAKKAAKDFKTESIKINSIEYTKKLLLDIQRDH